MSTRARKKRQSNDILCDGLNVEASNVGTHVDKTQDTFTPLHALPAIPELLSKTTTTDPILSKKEVKAAALSSPKKSKTSVSKSFKSKANTLAEPVPESLPTAPTTCGATAADSQALKRQSRVSALPVPAGRSRIPAPSRKVKTAAAATSISKTVSPPSQFDFTALTTPVSDELKLSQMTTREVANMTAKNTTKNAIFRTVTFEREVTQRTIPRPPSPDRKKRTAIARTLREQRELVEREKGIKLGAGDDLDFVPKVPSPTRKTVRWNEQLEVVFDGEDVKEPIAEPPSTLKSLLRQTIPAVQEEILDKLPIAQVKITKFLYKGEKD